MKLEIQNLTKTYPGITIFKNLDFSFKEGKTTCILGPSGCGKTTLLNLLAGTVKPDSGTLKPDTTGKVAFLFQESRLLPWMTVLGNVTYLMDRTVSEKEKKELGYDLIKKVGLSGFEKSYPAELSGGMERRVSLARALGKNAPLFLMDEPFSSLDDDLKDRMTQLMKDLFEKDRQTIIHVTHDSRIANKVADRIVYMERENGKTIIKQ